MKADAGTGNRSGRFRQTARNGFSMFLFIMVFSPHFLAQSVLSEAKSPYILSVVPQLPAVTMHTNWSPFVEMLKKETGEEFRIKVYDTMKEFEEDYTKGACDFLFANPVQAAAAHRAQGYIPLVRSGRKITGILFVRKDSNIYSLQDLRGKEVAFVGSKNL